ncbi:MAG: hypothetical protein U0414_43250 [Polyangiaceae bacterium]
MRRRLAAIAALLLSFGCSNEKKIDRDVPHRRTDDAETPDSAAPRAARDYSVVEITPDGRVLLDGEVMETSTRDLGDGHQVVNQPGLFNRLKQRRETWEIARSADTFPGVVGIEAAGDTRGVVLKSVVQAVAFAGYPRITLQIQGTKDFHDFVFSLPGPAGEQRPEHLAVHVSTKGEAYGAYLEAYDVHARQTEVSDGELEGVACSMIARGNEAGAALGETKRRFAAVIHFEESAPASRVARMLAALEACKPAPNGLFVSVP